MSRRQALRRWGGRQVIDELAARASSSAARRPAAWRKRRPARTSAYKDVAAVAEAADRAGLSRKVARLEPLICVKG